MYSIVDIEGNGAGYRQESIIDIAIFKFDGHEIVDQFMSLVNPESDITPFVQKLTGITPKMVKTAPKFHEIAKRIVEITEGTTLVGHNIDFDYRMLRQEFKKLGYQFKINTLDTIPLAKKLLPEAESYSLGKLVKSVGIPLLEAHRASGDARATLDLFKLLINKDSENGIIQKQYDETNSKTYINKVKELTQDLPNEKGLIYFQDENGKILYSDFVSDINKSAKKLFNSKSVRWEGVQRQCEQIYYELAGNAIVAKLLMKSKGIKKVEKFPIGLFYRKEKYLVEKLSINKEQVPVLKFKSVTQARKALHYISSQGKFKDVEVLKKLVDLKGRNEIWSLPGRTLGEKAFLILEKGKLTAFGFYEYYTQIQDLKKLNQLKLEISGSKIDLINDLKIGLLKNDFEIRPLPKK